MPGKPIDELDFREQKDPRRPVAALAVGATHELVVICDDGTAWMWAVPQRVLQKLSPAEEAQSFVDPAFVRTLPHEWVQFYMPIPGTAAYAEYSEVRGR